MMKLTVVNFADKSFKRNQNWNSFTAKYFGHADNVINYTPAHIVDYIEEHPQFKKYSYKGFGNYFWKPYIILKALNEIHDGDFLFYSDSGSIVLKNLKPLCRELNKNDKDIMAFKLPLISKQWTKRDCFVLMGADSNDFTDGNQFLCGFICIRKTSESLLFFQEFKKYCEDERIVSDLSNTQKIDNYPEFVAHRHDQSIFSILVKKSNIVLSEIDLSDYGLMPKKYVTSPSILFNIDDFSKDKIKFPGYVLSNRKEHPLVYLVKYFIKRVLRWQY